MRLQKDTFLSHNLDFLSPNSNFSIMAEIGLHSCSTAAVRK